MKVDHVNRSAVLDDLGEIRSGAAEAFSEENDAGVAKIAWLSKKDAPKAYGSMVVYLTESSDATDSYRRDSFTPAVSPDILQPSNDGLSPTNATTANKSDTKRTSTASRRCAEGAPRKDIIKAPATELS